MTGAAKQLGPRVELLGRGDDARQPLRNEARAGESMLVGGGIVSLHVQRFGTVGERVHGRAHGRLGRQADSQRGLVDDRRGMRATSAAAHPALGVAHAEVGRPLCTGVRRRDGDERQPGRGGDRLPEVDRAAATDGENPVSPARVEGLEPARDVQLARASGRAETRVAQEFVTFARERLA